MYRATTERKGAEHVLQRYNRHQSERIAQCPSATPLHQTLYGGLEDLKTTNFITAAGRVGEREEEEEEEDYYSTRHLFSVVALLLNNVIIGRLLHY